MSFRQYLQSLRYYLSPGRRPRRPRKSPRRLEMEPLEDRIVLSHTNGHKLEWNNRGNPNNDSEARYGPQ